MQFGIEVVPFGDYGNPRLVMELAQAAEAAHRWPNMPQQAPPGGLRPSSAHAGHMKNCCSASKPAHRADNSWIRAVLPTPMALSTSAPRAGQSIGWSDLAKC